MVKKIIMFIVIFSLYIYNVNAADTVTSGTMLTSYYQGGNAYAIKYLVTSDSNGKAIFATDNVVGKIVQWFIFPSQIRYSAAVTSGSETLVPEVQDQMPTNLFDITFKDESDIDLLRGDGANLSSSTITAKYESDSTKLPIQTIGRLTFAAENMGSTRTLTLKIFYKYE